MSPRPINGDDLNSITLPTMAVTESSVHLIGSNNYGNCQHQHQNDHRHHTQIVFYKMENLIREMQHESTGVPVRSQKMFLTSIPSAFMGNDVIEWIMERLNIEDPGEATHLANLLCQHGYFFPVNDSKNLVMKDDSSLYRFQTPYYWPSRNHNCDNVEYAIYLTKRTMRNKQRHGLEEYEQECLNNLKKALSPKWEFVCMQAEDQLRHGKDKKKSDRIVLNFQEKAFWRVQRPPANYINSLEMAPVPTGRIVELGEKSLQELKAQVTWLREYVQLSRTKASQAIESLIHQCETFEEYDAFVSAAPPLPSNAWITDDPAMWEFSEQFVPECSLLEKRVRRWGLSLRDLVRDPSGLQEFEAYLKKEYSDENIRFWKAVEELKRGAKKNMNDKVNSIYQEFLAPGAACEVNLDCRTSEETQRGMRTPSRYTFDVAQTHVYSLMQKDSYPRFLRSDSYKNLLANSIQPSQKKRFFNFGAAAKKKNSTAAAMMTPSSAATTVSIRGCGVQQHRPGSIRNTITGSTCDLRASASIDGSSGIIGGGGGSGLVAHSLSASNLHTLDVV